MKRKLFTISTIAVMAIMGIFVLEHVTSAQRSDRNRQGREQGRGGRGMMDMMNPVSLVDNSWIDLTFALKVDDETLVKARPIYQASRDKFEAKMKELRAAGDMRSAIPEMRKHAATVGKEFQASLKEVLTEEQMTQLNELTKKRQMQQANRMNRWRDGGGRRGGGNGGSQ